MVGEIVMKIEVTQNHIDNGGDSCFNCSVSLAIQKMDSDNIKCVQTYFDEIRINTISHSLLKYKTPNNVLSCKKMHEFIFTHIPIHTESIKRYRGNIHGHLHMNMIDDPRYLNICVEHWDYTPQPLETIHKLMKERGC